MLRLILSRHGQTDWNAQHRYQGETDVPLNETGRQQAEALARCLADAGIEAIYSSDLLRAWETARAVSESTGAPLVSDVGLRERGFGVFQGKTFAEIIRSTEENSPRNKKTRKRQPSTYDWDLGWTYNFSYSLEPDEDSDKVHCDIMLIDPVLTYDILITLPALTDDSALNPMEKKLWKNYVATLLEQAHNRIKIIKDDTRDVILRQFNEIAYLSLSNEETENADSIVERFVRTATEKIGSTVIRQIQQKLESYESGASQDAATKPPKTPPTKSLSP